MAESIQKLEYLVELKKTKKDPNKIERDEFYQAWTDLAMEEGFSEQAEKYLYTGFTYCGARPFLDYIMLTDDNLSELNKLYKGRMYGDNCASTSPILIHLIALVLNQKECDIRLLISLIQHLPNSLRNKEGKIYGQAGRALKKYFLDELITGIRFPDIKTLMESGMKQYQIRDFKKSIDEIMSSMDFAGFSQKCKENIYAINRWLKNDSKENAPETSVVRIPEITEVSPAERQHLTGKHDDNNSPAVTENCKGHQQYTPTSSNSISGAKDAPNETQDDKILLEQFKSRIADLEFTVREERRKCEAIQKRLEETALTLAEREKELKEECQVSAELRQQIAQGIVKNRENEARISEMERELHDRTAMMEMLRKDRSKQSSESLKRMSSKLRSYYLDFTDATGLEMSIELGENLRDQMGEVFKILESGGVTLN